MTSPFLAAPTATARPGPVAGHTLNAYAHTHANETPLRVRDSIGALRDEMHTLLTVAQYVASSMSVFEAINFRADRSPAFAQTMGEVHPTWRDPDYHGETLGALAQLIGMAWGRVSTTCAAIDPPAGAAAGNDAA